MKHLIDLYEAANEDDIREGKLAYFRYNDVLRSFADFYGFGIVPTVEAFAALSPNSDYHGNLRSLASVLSGVRDGVEVGKITVSTYNACAERAYGYVSGETSFLDTVKGRKITAFRHNLLYPETSKEVTVDGHMFAAFKGDPNMTMKEAAYEFGRSSKAYLGVAKAIKTMALKRGLLPHQIQAILWITRKRSAGNKYDTQLHFDHGVDDVSRIVCDPKDYPPYNRKERAA